jgi:hypothetical protein
LRDVITVLPAGEWQPKPALQPKLPHTNVVNAYIKLQAKNVNPFITPVVIDTHSSPRFSNYALDACPCITRTRAAQRGYWCSTKGGYLDAAELSKLQGFRCDEVAWEAAGVKERAYCGALGNAMSLNVVVRLLPRALYSAKIVKTRAEYEFLCQLADSM